MSDLVSTRQQSESTCLTDQLERPSLDDRHYRVIRLKNELEALLIHDPNTDKASAALDVNAGAFSDDEDLPGMAHAVEHLLFMGTKKYPKENEYNQYLAANSGYSNAFTAATSTNYYFECAATSGMKNADDATKNSPEYAQQSPLYGALDRFAQFFIGPLFLEETLDRELRAVDSENKKNLQSDTWRLMQLSKSLANPEHPYCHFSTGNLKTLRDDPLSRGVKIRDEFMRFHSEQYSANRMKLVVLGRESVDELQSWVEEFFTGVENKSLPQNRWDGIPPYTEQQLKTRVFAKPVMDTRSLEIVFQYQDEEKLYDSQPGRYLSHLIGHEGPGSILSYIKARGWANELSAGAMPLCPGSALFTISIRMTADGLKNYNEILESVFCYLSILREIEPQEWMFNEMKEMAEVDFRFQQKATAHRTTSGLSQAMQKPIPRERLLNGLSVMRTFDPAAVRKALQFLNPNNFRITVVSQNALPGEAKKERWYGTEYYSEPIPDAILTKIRQAFEGTKSERPRELFLPSKNEFIPSKLHVDRKDVKDPARMPKLLRNDDISRLWFKKDDQFWVPKASFHFCLRTPVCSASPRNMVMAQLIVELVQDTLTEYTYDAEIAGLAYSLAGYSGGIHATITGYNDKMHILLEKVIHTLRTLEIKGNRFDVIKERVSRAFKNFEYSTPYQQIGQYTRWLGTEKGYITEEQLAELTDVTADDLRMFLPLLLRQAHIEALAVGNVHKEDAMRMLDIVIHGLNPLPLPSSQWPIRRSLILPNGSNFLYTRPLKDAMNVNNCIQYILQVGSVEDRERHAKLLLFAQMTQEPAFDQLRTKEQLGYVVFSGSLTQLTTSAYQILIQSERSPDYLEQRIESFLIEFGKQLHGMSSIDFDSHKRSIINRRLEKIKNLGQESNRFWGHITNEFYFFDEFDDDVTQIRGLSKEDMIEFYETYIQPGSRTRAKLSVQLIARAGAELEGKAIGIEKQRCAVTDIVHNYFNSEGIALDKMEIGKYLSSIDLNATGASERVLVLVRDWLKARVDLSVERQRDLLAKARSLMTGALPVMGVGMEESRPAEPNAGRASSIEDVRGFKTSLSLSKGARPRRELSAFEEMESKL